MNILSDFYFASFEPFQTLYHEHHKAATAG